MRVGIDATTWWNNRGFGRFTRELIRALAARRSFEYTLVVDRPPAPDFPDGVDVLEASASRTVTESAVQDGARSPGDMWALSRVVAKARFDVFFFPAVYSYFPLTSRTPSVVVFHDMIAERFPELVFPTPMNRRLWKTKVKLATWQARRIMTVSQASAKDITRVLGVLAKKIDVVTEAADPIFRRLNSPERHTAERRDIDIPVGVPLLVYVGGLNPHKNLITLLRAMPAVLEKDPNVHLAIVGDTSKRGFFDNVDELLAFVDARPALKARVRFTGYISDEALVALYSGATALAYPSLLEGFGLPAVEAMACGLPIVASDRGSLPEVVGDAGLFFDPHLPTQIAERLTRVIRDDKLREKLQVNALMRAQTFTWDAGAALAEESFLRCSRS